MLRQLPEVFIDLTHTLFSKHNRKLLWSSIYLLAAIECMVVAAHEFILWLLGDTGWVGFPIRDLIFFLIPIHAVIVASRSYQQQSAAWGLRVNRKPDDCDGLVLFVSKAYNEAIVTEENDIKVLNSSLKTLSTTELAMLKSHLRMLFEAVAFHCTRPDKKIPKRITLIASKESFPLVGTVKAAIEGCIAHLGLNCDVFTVADLGQDKWAAGVVYTDADEVIAVIDSLNKNHQKANIVPREVIVDVTGGLGITSAVASMTALKTGNRVEHTSSGLDRKIYVVRVFNFEFTEPVEPA